jgi:hypothetical protein
MENKSMTAVEWLEQEFIALQNYGVNELGLFAKAKEMEKQQIENAFENGMDAANIYNLEQYYNETFNK